MPDTTSNSFRCIIFFPANKITVSYTLLSLSCIYVGNWGQEWLRDLLGIPLLMNSKVRIWPRKSGSRALYRYVSRKQELWETAQDAITVLSICRYSVWFHALLERETHQCFLFPYCKCPLIGVECISWTSLNLHTRWSQSAGTLVVSPDSEETCGIKWFSGKCWPKTTFAPNCCLNETHGFFFVLKNSSGGLKLLFPFICMELTKIALYKQQKVWKGICTLSLLCQNGNSLRIHA